MENDMTRYYLAIDIGASSGRHILGSIQDGKLTLEEVYRFENGFHDVNGTKCWDADQLFSQIKAGMVRCAEAGKIPVSMGIDTWGVDYVFLDSAGQRLGEAVAYRDDRTEGMDAEVYKLIPEDQLYGRTGIQKQLYNTIYQLMAVKTQTPELLEQAATLLMTPDYYHYLLTGKMAAEYTIASTSQLVSPVTCDWDWELIDTLGYPRRIFAPVHKPGTVLGSLTEEVQKEVSFNCQVVLPPAHDTASAVLAVPAAVDAVYISSGTWSLMGVEREEADCSGVSKAHNFTNEGGYDYRFRYLKNIMGLWMIQNVKKECDDRYSFAQLCDMASRESIPSIVDCYDNAFLAPENMSEAVRDYCRRTNQSVPETPGQLAAVIYNSLAKCYGDTVQEIEDATGKHYDRIHIVGGGANASYLNELTARYTGRTVYAGPTEATAIGNLLCQMITGGELENTAAAKACVRNSFDLETYQP